MAAMIYDSLAWVLRVVYLFLRTAVPDTTSNSTVYRLKEILGQEMGNDHVSRVTLRGLV